MTELASRSGTPVLFIWICDVSNDMRHGKKIDELNKAIGKIINNLKEFNKKNLICKF